MLRHEREQRGLPRSHVAAEVEHRGRRGVSESTVARLELAKYWPENPDAMVNAYAHVLDISPCQLWERAVRDLCESP